MSDTTPPRLNDQEREILGALRRLMRTTNFGARQLGDATGLASSELLILQVLEADGQQTAGRLAKDLLFSKSTITEVLDGLEEHQFISRQRHPVDGRSVVVSLTDQGRQFLSATAAPYQARLLERFQALPDWERSMLVSALQRLCHLLGAAKTDSSLASTSAGQSNASTQIKTN